MSNQDEQTLSFDKFMDDIVIREEKLKRAKKKALKEEDTPGRKYAQAYRESLPGCKTYINGGK